VELQPNGEEKKENSINCLRPEKKALEQAHELRMAFSSRVPGLNLNS